MRELREDELHQIGGGIFIAPIVIKIGTWAVATIAGAAAAHYAYESIDS